MKQLFSFKGLLVAVVIIKLLVILIGSHPFDFATYVYQARSYFEYDIHPLFSWNKGMPLLVLFYLQYAIYQGVTALFTAGAENTLLLHLVYKLPFLGFDLLTAYLMYKILHQLTNDPRRAQFGAILWLLNPFTLWSVQFHGSYAIFATFMCMASLLFLIQRRYMMAPIALALSASIYYYALILIPFYVLWAGTHAKRGKILTALGVGGVFLGTLGLMYLPFILSDSVLASGFINSLMSHATPDAASAAEAIRLPNYSLFKIPYNAVFSSFPTNLTAPGLFKFLQIFTLTGLLVIAIYGLVRLRKTIKTKQYRPGELLQDLLVALTIFLLCIGHFQDHYLVWIFPFLILAGVYHKSGAILRNTYFIGLVAILGVIGAGSIGIYLLDVIPFGKISIYLAQSEYTQSLAGFAIVVMLIASPLMLLRKKSYKWEVEDNGIIAAVAVGFIFMAGLSIASLTFILSGAHHGALGSDQNVYNFRYLAKETTVESTKTELHEVPVQDYSFEDDNIGLLNPNHKISSKSDWYYYNFSNSAIAGVITPDAHTGKRALQFKPSKPGAAAQINLGANQSTDLIPVDINKRYRISIFAKLTSFPSTNFKASVRFANAQRNIISGSDTKLEITGGDNGWELYTLDVVPPKEAAYIEPLISVTTDASSSFVANSLITVDDIKIAEIKEFKQISMVDLGPQHNAAALNKYVLESTPAGHFKFRITVPSPPRGGGIASATLGTCTEQGIPKDEPALGASYDIFYFDTKCLHARDAHAAITTYNYTQNPDIQLALAHNVSSSYHVQYHKTVFMLLGIFGLLLNAFLVVYSLRKIFTMRSDR